MIIPVDGSEHLPEDVTELQNRMKPPAEHWAEQNQHILYRVRHMWHCTRCHAEGNAPTEADAYWQARKHPCR